MNCYTYLVFLISLLIQPIGLHAHSKLQPQIAKRPQPEKETIPDCKTYDILSLNTWGLPISTTQQSQMGRFDELSNKLLVTNFDVVCLQECFHPELRKRIGEKLSSKYEIAADLQCTRKTFMGLLHMDCYGGLVTLSKHPIEYEVFIPFPDQKKMNLFERIGAKGFLFSVIDLDGKKINVINTHLYAGNGSKAEAHRMVQVKFIEEEIAKLGVEYPHDIVLVGDLNVTHPAALAYNKQVRPSETYEYITDQLSFHNDTKDIAREAFTVDPLCNRYSSTKDGGVQKLDYCLIKNTERAAASTSITKVSTIFKDADAISDHMGLHAILRVESGTVSEVEPTVTASTQALLR